MSTPFSFELFPPRSAAAAAALPAVVDELIAARPEFVSVTYGADGSSREQSLDVLSQLLEAGVQPMAHLTCVGLTALEANVLVRRFLDAGITKFLALRGDPPASGEPVHSDLGSASELVQLIHRVEAEREPYRIVRVRGLEAAIVAPRPKRVDIAVAAFPNGHPGSSDRRDIDALLAKQASGATHAITQLFFDVDDYVAFVDLARAAGVTIPIVPGVVVPTSLRRLERCCDLSGERPPAALAERLAAADASDGARIGVEWGVDFVSRLIDAGVPGLHLYTFNQHRASLDVLSGVGAIDVVHAPSA